MATTVRVRDGDKSYLDALQAKFRLRIGRKISLDDLVHRIVELAEEHEDEILMEDAPRKLTAAEVEAFLGTPGDSGMRTDEDDIDKILYGGEDAA